MKKNITDYINESCYTESTPEIRKYLEENFKEDIEFDLWDGDKYILLSNDFVVTTIWDGSGGYDNYLHIPTEEFKELIGMTDNIDTNSNTTSGNNLSKDSKFNLELTLGELVAVRLLVGNVNGHSDFRGSTDTVHDKMFDILPKFEELETPLFEYTEIVGNDYEGEYKQMLSKLTTNPEEVKLNELKQLLNETKSKISEMEDKLNQ